MKKPLRKKLEYKELRDAIHDILLDFLGEEMKAYKRKEFDFEWMEHKTDDILTLIQLQGGDY